MTHSLHREGSAESLRNDYVLYARCARGINWEGAEPKLRRLAEIAFDEGPANSGYSSRGANMANGLWDREAALDSMADGHGFFICCFDDRDKVKRVLRRLKEEELGITVVVSGLVDELEEVARETGLCAHTLNGSLGVRGKLELLPGPEVLEITTMCGHGMVAAALVDRAIHRVRSGALSPAEAARLIGRPCTCGILNLTRAEASLKRIASEALESGAGES